MSSPDEPFEGQNSQFRDPQPGGPTGIPPHWRDGAGSTGNDGRPGQSGTYGQSRFGTPPPAPYGPDGSASPPYGAQPYGQQPYGTQPYGQPGYGQGGYGQGGYGGSGYGQPAPWNRPMGPPPQNYLVYAILTTIFCCMPLGIASIVFAAQVNSRWAAGDAWGAQSASKRAQQFAMWSALTTVALAALYIIIGVATGYDF